MTVSQSVTEMTREDAEASVRKYPPQKADYNQGGAGWTFGGFFFSGFSEYLQLLRHFLLVSLTSPLYNDHVHVHDSFQQFVVISLVCVCVFGGGHGEVRDFIENKKV